MNRRSFLPAPGRRPLRSIDDIEQVQYDSTASSCAGAVFHKRDVISSGQRFVFEARSFCSAGRTPHRYLD